MILLMFFYQVDPTSSCCFYKEIPLSIWKMRNGSKVKKKKSKTGAWGEPLLLQFILCIPSFFLLCRVQTKTRMQHVLHRFALLLFIISDNIKILWKLIYFLFLVRLRPGTFIFFPKYILERVTEVKKDISPKMYEK